WVRRRASESGSGWSTGLFMGCPHDGTDDAVVRAAAAEVLVQRLAHLLLRRLSIGGKQRRSSDGDAAHAVPALRRLLGNQRALDRMKLTVAAQALNGGDVLALGKGRRHVARRHRAAVHKDEARAALTAATAEAAADEAELVAQDVEERSVRFRVDGADAAIH